MMEITENIKNVIDQYRFFIEKVKTGQYKGYDIFKIGNLEKHPTYIIKNDIRSVTAHGLLTQIAFLNGLSWNEMETLSVLGHDKNYWMD